MKTITKIIAICLMLTVFTGTVKSQLKKGNVVISGGTAHSILVPLIPRLIEAGSSTLASQSVKAYSNPGINFAVDYSLGRMVSIGAGITYQKAGVDYVGHTYYTGTKERHENCNFSISRANIGFRTLFHYSKLKKLDLYQGFRIGYSTWNVSLDSNDPNFSFHKQQANAPSWQIIVLGLKYFPDPTIGIGAEFAGGSPYYGSLSICAKF